MSGALTIPQRAEIAMLVDEIIAEAQRLGGSSLEHLLSEVHGCARTLLRVDYANAAARRRDLVCLAALALLALLRHDAAPEAPLDAAQAGRLL